MRATMKSNIAATEPRLGRLKVVSEQVPVPPSDWAAEVQRLREELARLRTARSVQPIPTNQQNVEKTFGGPRCNRVGGQKVNFGSDGHDPARSCAVSQFGVHCEQHGCVVRIVERQMWVVRLSCGKSQQPRSKSTDMTCGRTATKRHGPSRVGFGSDDSTSTELREREPVSIRPSTLASSSMVGVALVMNATTQEMVNPTMVDLAVLDSASEVDDHVHGGSGDCGIMGTQPTAVDPRSSNRFNDLNHDSDTERIGNSLEGTSSESQTESLLNAESRVGERTVQAVKFSI